MANRRKGGHLIPVLCLLIALIFVAMLLHPFQSGGSIRLSEGPGDMAFPGPSTRAANRTEEIENIILRINETLLAKNIQKLQDYGTRYAYRVDKCYLASAHIHSMFERNGLVTSYDPFVYKGWNMRNVIGEKPGTSPSDGIFIICAHYDSVSLSGNAWTNAPGADDNGSGTAAVMAAAEILSDYEFNYTIRCIAFSGEEMGLRGSAHYANNSRTMGENILGVLNLDMIGYNPEGRIKVITRTNTDSETLADFIVQTSQKYNDTILIEALKQINPATNSDHASFWQEGYQANFLHEQQFNAPNYHSIRDTIDKLNMTYCANATQIAIATMAELAELNSTDNAPPAHTPGLPPPNGYGNATPTISIEITDPTPLNLSTLVMWVNGIFTSPNLVPIPLGRNVTFVPALPYTDGQIVNVTLCMNDSADNGFNYSWEFTVDAIAPDPPTNLTIILTRIEAVKRGLVIDLGISGEDDDNHALSPCVIYHDNEYKMWYTGHNGSKYHIMYANSTDGINWEKHGIVLHNGPLGDADDFHAMYPSVIFDGGEYKMWYTGNDGTTYGGYRIMYANSSDGLTWNKHGVVIDLGPGGSLDTTYAYASSVIKTDEYKMWYTGMNGDDYWILYANSSDGINWDKHPEPVVTRDLESNREHKEVIATDPCVVYDGQKYHMWYAGYDSRLHRTLYTNSIDGLSWNGCSLAINIGASGEYDSTRAKFCSAMIVGNETKIWYSGYDGTWRIMYSNLTESDNKTDIGISWTASSSGDLKYYEICVNQTPDSLNPWETHAIWGASTYVENRLGDGNSTNYYYKIRAIDKVGNVEECDTIIGKIGTDMVSGWSLIANPFLNEGTKIHNALLTCDWDCARSYNAFDPAEPWKTNISGRPYTFNTLDTINQTIGIWAHVNTAEVYAPAGIVKNITINLQPGWNLIAYPYHEIKTVSDALAGLPWDAVEGFSATNEYGLIDLNPTDDMYPGSGYWIHCTSAAVWDATNT